MTGISKYIATWTAVGINIDRTQTLMWTPFPLQRSQRNYVKPWKSSLKSLSPCQTDISQVSRNIFNLIFSLIYPPWQNDSWEQLSLLQFPKFHREIELQKPISISQVSSTSSISPERVNLKVGCAHSIRSKWKHVIALPVDHRKSSAHCPSLTRSPFELVS
jgi:hypothetical protein